jgi:hypothetical protein
MVVVRLLVVVFLLVAHTGWSQPAAARRALRALDDERWEKSRIALDKAWQKDSAAVTTLYALARYYFHSANPAYDLDTAHVFAVKARAAPPARRGPDSVTLERLHIAVDSAAFVRARTLHATDAYLFFLRKYDHAAQRDSARTLLYEVAWQDALDFDTPEAFQEYVEDYPESPYVERARARREELLFKTRTKDQRLESYEAFLSEYPQSPYRHIVEEQILEIFTADGSPEKYSAFLRRYPTGPAARKAAGILYHLAIETGSFSQGAFPILADSLERITALNAAVLVPFTSNRRFGFMDTSGREVIDAEATSLSDDYRCGGIREDVLVHGSKVIARDGSVLFRGPVSELHDMGFGFIGIVTPDCYRVMHKSGFSIGGNCAEDAMVLEGRFVAVANNDQWSIFTLTGRELTSGWDDVKSVGNGLALQKDGRYYLVGFSQLGRVADMQPLSNLQGYDEVSPWPGNRLWVKLGEEEAVYGENLKIEIPAGNHRLYPEAFGGRCVHDDGSTMLYVGTRESPMFEEARVQVGRVAVRRAGRWHFYDPATDSVSAAYDSISFYGVFAAGHRGDTIRILFDGDSFRDFIRTPLRFVPGREGRAFLQAGSNKLSLFDRQGNLLFEGTYDAIQHAGGHYFIVSRREKKGVVTADGKPLLPLVYDAIGDVDGDRIPLLRAMNFGMYSIATGREIRPSYEKNIIPYNNELLVAWRKGKSGIIDFNNSIRIPFRYDGFRFWNDSAAWARDGETWKIIDLKKGSVLVDAIREFKVVSESDKEVVVIARQGSDFGVLSSMRGVIIPIEYTEVVNVGTSDSPLFFTEKHVREADLSVVIYYDAHGNAVRRQALDPEEFDQLSCDQ